jgi:tetratricopeptide (TPR) repeat protein
MATKPFFCDECGTRNTHDSKYCKECGAMLSVSYQTLALQEHDRIDDPTDQERLTQFLDMAFWHNEAGNIDAAVRACRAALAINPNSTTGLSLLGSLCERQGDNEQAIIHFERVLALNPESGADQVKLAQLKEGIHVKPIRASPVYRWLPFALGSARFSDFSMGMRERWTNLRRPEMSLPPARMTYALAGGVAFVVIVGAFLLSKPSPSIPANAEANVPSVAHSAYGGASASTRSALPVIPPLITLPARPGTPLASPPFQTASVPSADPFAGEAPVPMTSSLPHDYRLDRTPAATSGHLHALPPLVAVPDAGNGPLPPAPISVEPNAPIAPDSNMARHTIVVHRLNGLSEFAAPGVSSSNVADNGASGQGDDQDNTPSPQSSIQISVDPATGGNTQGNSSASNNGASGEDDQQSAFALQQQGHYRQAAALYAKAIGAYQAQVASGQNVDAAQRGLQACQTGLQICRQSQ